MRLCFYKIPFTLDYAYRLIKTITVEWTGLNNKYQAVTQNIIYDLVRWSVKLIKRDVYKGHPQHITLVRKVGASIGRNP